MIITLVKADFSKNNIGVLNAFSVVTSLGNGCTYLGPRNVANGGPLSASVVISEKYLFKTVTMTMGGVEINDYTVDGNTITINVASVTGRIVITVATELVVGDNMIPVTLTLGNDYASGFINQANRASIQPYAIIIPEGVTIIPKDGYKMAIYTNFKSENMGKSTSSATQTGGSAWDTVSYTGQGKAVGIAIAKNAGDFDFSDVIYASDVLTATDDSMWFIKEDEIPEGAGTYSNSSSSGGNTSGDNTSGGNTTPPAGGIAFETAVFDYGNAFGTGTQTTDKNRATSTEWIELKAGDVVGLKDNVNYKWALRGQTQSSYWPDTAWTQKAPQTIVKADNYKFILLKADNSNFDFENESNLVSEYYTLERA